MKEYPLNIELLKLETLTTAEHPQEDKYPSGEVVSIGLMFEHTKPKVGEAFYVMRSKLNPIFRTSAVKEIEELVNGDILLITLNSKYKIIIKE